MSQENKRRVEDIIDAVGEGLGPYVLYLYKKKYTGKKYLQEIRTVLSLDFDVPDEATALKRFDIENWLNSIIYRWNDVFPNKPDKVIYRTYFYGLRDARTKGAHPKTFGPFTDDQVRHVAATAILLLKGTNAEGRKQIPIIQKIEEELGRLIYGESEQKSTEKPTPASDEPLNVRLRKKDLSWENFSKEDLSRRILQGKDLRWADLTGTDLSGSNLRNANLTRANLEDAILENADLAGANLTGANLSKANLQLASLAEADLSYADLTAANLQGASLPDAILKFANLRNAVICFMDFHEIVPDTVSDENWGEYLDSIFNNHPENYDSGQERKHVLMWGADLSNANLIEANLGGVEWSRVNLSNANLSGANLSGADYLGSATLTGANFSGVYSDLLWPADWSGANLRGINLSGAQLGHANLRGANLAGADLSEVDFTVDGESADLESAKLMDANLTGANLSKTNLTKADLRGANLTKADLTNAWLVEADLTNANLTDANLSGAILTKADLADLRESEHSTRHMWWYHPTAKNLTSDAKFDTSTTLPDGNLWDNTDMTRFTG